MPTRTTTTAFALAKRAATRRCFSTRTTTVRLVSRHALSKSATMTMRNSHRRRPFQPAMPLRRRRWTACRKRRARSTVLTMRQRRLRPSSCNSPPPPRPPSATSLLRVPMGRGCLSPRMRHRRLLLWTTSVPSAAAARHLALPVTLRRRRFRWTTSVSAAARRVASARCSKTTMTRCWICHPIPYNARTTTRKTPRHRHRQAGKQTTTTMHRHQRREPSVRDVQAHHRRRAPQRRRSPPCLGDDRRRRRSPYTSTERAPAEISQLRLSCSFCYARHSFATPHERRRR